MAILDFLSSKKYELLAFALPLLLLIVSYRGTATSFDNVAAQYSIWKTGSPSLGSVGNPIATHLANVSGTFVYNGNYYNIHAPGFQYISLPFAILGFLHDGGVLIYPAMGATIADDAFLALCVALSSLILYKICLMYASKIPSLLASLTLAFGTLAWPFSTVTFDHDLAMTLSLLGVYFTLRIKKRENNARKKLLLISGVGLSIGLSCFVEYLAILLIIPILAYLLHDRKQIQLRMLDLSILLPTLSIGPILDLLYNQVIFGNPLI
ncbi:MAG: glycosyltransferase family 39 protein, partial [Nitrosopumilaceae archaeon]